LRQAEGRTVQDFKDRRVWYAVAAVIIVLIIIGYATGWFGGAPAPAPQQ
jgi:Flp pilus assembly protein protease CpaA